MKTPFFLLLFILFGATTWANTDADSLKSVINSLPRVDRGNFLVSYGFTHDADSGIVTFIESRHSPDGKFTDPRKGHYRVHLNDLDAERVEINSFPEGDFELVMHCNKGLPLSDLILKDSTTVHDVFQGPNIRLGRWKQAGVRAKCETIARLMRKLIANAPPKALVLADFDAPSLDFKVVGRAYFEFDDARQEYVLKSKTDDAGKIHYKNGTIRVEYQDEKPASYKVGKARFTETSDRIHFDVNSRDVLMIAFSPNRDHMVVLAVDYKVLYIIEP